MKTKAKSCIDCGNEGTIERRRCYKCLTTYNRNRAKKYSYNLKKQGIKKNRYGKIECFICGLMMIKNRPNQIAHGQCKKIIKVSYNVYPRDNKGSMIGRRIIIDLGINLSTKDIVHHVDENPINNSYKNLLIMSISNHNSLHSFLREEFIKNKKIYGDKIDKVWKKILIKLNFIWIESKKIKLVTLDDKYKFSEIEINKENIYMLNI